METVDGNPVDGAGPAQPLYYVDMKEVKATHNGRKSYKFFLIDNHGKEHLAATGEETADAHYNYASTAEFASFGQVHGHTRKELLMWLEQVMKESGQMARGEALDPEHVVHLGEPTPADPFGIFFVNYREERTHLPDGRRCNKWWLIDQHGQEHLAVVGEERDTRDAHYFYHATEAFATNHPLNCNNQQKVCKWVEAMLTHHYPPGTKPDPPIVVTAATPGEPQSPVVTDQAKTAQPQSPTQTQGQQSAAAHTQTQAPAASAGVPEPTPAALATPMCPIKTESPGTLPGSMLPLKPPSVISTGQGQAKTTAKPPSSTKAAPGTKPPATKHKLVGVAQDAHLKRLRRLAAESEEALRAAEAAHLMRLRRAAEGETCSREAVRRSTAQWVRGELSSEDERTLSSVQDTLQQLITEANKEQLQQVQYNALRLVPDLNQQLSVASRVHLVVTPAGEHSDAPQHPAPGSGDGDGDAATQPQVAGTGAQQGSQQGGSTDMDVDAAAACQHAISPAAAQDTPPGDPAGAGGAAGAGGVKPRGVVQVESRTVSSWTYADPHTNKHAVRLVLECLREVESVMMPLQVMLSSPLVDLVRTYAEQHPHPAVAQLAQHILGIWQRSTLARLRALVSPGVLEDPVAQLEFKIARGLIEYPPDIIEKQRALQAQLSPVTVTPLPSLLSFNNTPNSDTLPFTAIDLSASLAAAMTAAGKGLPATPSLNVPMGAAGPGAGLTLPNSLPPLMLTPAAGVASGLGRTFTATSPPPVGSAGNFGPTLALDVAAPAGRGPGLNPLSQLDLAAAAAGAGWPAGQQSSSALGNALHQLMLANAGMPLGPQQLQAVSGQGVIPEVGGTTDLAGSSVCAPPQQGTSSAM